MQTMQKIFNFTGMQIYTFFLKNWKLLTYHTPLVNKYAEGQLVFVFIPHTQK